MNTRSTLALVVALQAARQQGNLAKHRNTGQSGSAQRPSDVVLIHRPFRHAGLRALMRQTSPAKAPKRVSTH
jgi:hypothetical protein